jgi:hypothetical protein
VFFVGAEYLTTKKEEKRKGKRKSSIRNLVLAITIVSRISFWSAIK